VLKYQPIESALTRPPALGPEGFPFADADLAAKATVFAAINDGEGFEALLSTTSEADCKGVPTPKPPYWIWPECSTAWLVVTP
jgi:hypothetical protein